MNKKPENYLRILITTAGAAVLMVVVFSVFYFNGAKAQSTELLSGTGWIKFSSDTENGVSPATGVNYGVYIYEGGLIAGTAWSSDYGWLSFNSGDLLNCPGGECLAKVDLDNGNVSGWARFISAAETDWGGWVHLRGTAADNSSYGVNFDGDNLDFSGAAWGSDLIGWIVFGSPECDFCTVRVDGVNQPPTISEVSIEGPAESWCDSDLFYRARWTYNDPDSDTQQAFDIQFIRISDNAVVFSDSISGTDGVQKLYRLNNPLSTLDPNVSYKVKVRAFDGSVFSDWSESSATTTPTHYYPLVSFTMSPDPTATGMRTVFTDTSQDRTAGAFPIRSINWQFENGTPGQSSASNPAVKFSSLPSTATSTIEDSSGASCIGSKEVTGGGTSGPIKRRIFRER